LGRGNLTRTKDWTYFYIHVATYLHNPTGCDMEKPSTAKSL